MMKEKEKLETRKLVMKYTLAVKKEKDNHIGKKILIKEDSKL